VAAVVVPAATLLTAGASSYLPARFSGEVPSSALGTTPCVQVVAARSPELRSAANRTPYIVSTGEPHSVIVQARATRALPVGVASEKGLQIKTILAARAVSAMFPEIHAIGGVRPDALRWHPEGLAIDVMIPNYQSAAGKALGDRIAAFALQNAQRFDLNHVMWRQVLYMPDGTARHLADYGSDDANHYTHVHIATNGDGYPTGIETYVN
jgi:hypothetical protein